MPKTLTAECFFERAEQCFHRSRGDRKIAVELDAMANEFMAKAVELDTKEQKLARGATLPSNAVKYVQSAASSTRTGDTDQMQTDYLVTVWYEGEPKKPAAKKSARR
jgi:hypothetical protein